MRVIKERVLEWRDKRENLEETIINSPLYLSMISVTLTVVLMKLLFFFA